jgi:hypothetical protein
VARLRPHPQEIQGQGEDQNTWQSPSSETCKKTKETMMVQKKINLKRKRAFPDLSARDAKKLVTTEARLIPSKKQKAENKRSLEYYRKRRK